MIKFAKTTNLLTANLIQYDMLRRVFLSILLVCAILTLQAQNAFTLNAPSDMLQDDLSRAANEYYSYEALDLTNRDAINGCKPVGIVSVARGACRFKDDLTEEYAVRDYYRNLAVQGKLNDSEMKLLEQIERIVKMCEENKGKIFQSCIDEQAQIQKRLSERFHTVLGKEVQAKVTTHTYPLENDYLSATGGDFRNRAIGLIVRYSSLLGGSEYIKSLFTQQEVLGYWKRVNAEIFKTWCVSKENKGAFVSEKLGVYTDILKDLDAAVTTMVPTATFRTVDVATFQALLCIIGASGNDYVGPESDSNAHYAAFNNICSSANFVFVIYRNDAADTYIKMLHNEREVGIQSLVASKNVYFDWETIKQYLDDRIEGSYKKPALEFSVTYKRILKNDDTDLETIGKVKAPKVGAEANPFWSIGCECLDRGYADFKQYEPFLNELGAGYARIQSGWQKCEPEKGVYSFEWLDEIVDGIIATGLTPWMTLCYGNSNYTKSGASLAAEIFTDEETLTAWENYVRAVVQRYKGKVAMYEIWNEPDFGGTLRRALPFANLSARTAPIIREIDPDAKIAGISLAGSMNLKFGSIVLEHLKERDALKYIDCFIIHPYGDHPESRIPRIKELKEIISTYSPNIKIVEGEVGYVSDLYIRKQKDYDEVMQAKGVLRMMAMCYGLGIPTSIFSIIDNLYPNRLQSHGLLRANLKKRPAYRRPSFYSYRNMASILNAGSYSEGDVSVKCKSDKTLSAVSICRNGKSVGAMLWYSGEVMNKELSKEKIDILLEGLNLSDPVYVDPMTGRVYKLNKFRNTKRGLHLKKLPVWDSPVMVIERTEVEDNSAK